MILITNPFTHFTIDDVKDSRDCECGQINHRMLFLYAVTQHARLRSNPPEPVAWRLDTEPLTTPDGDPLGVALYCTRFPDSADPVPEFDTPQHAERLEMAHFASEDQATKFEAEFRSYLVPGLIDGPELAEEVAKLEGWPGNWIEMEGDTLVREANEWQVHDPHVERDNLTPSSIAIDF